MLGVGFGMGLAVHRPEEMGKEWETVVGDLARENSILHKSLEKLKIDSARFISPPSINETTKVRGT